MAEFRYVVTPLTLAREMGAVPIWLGSSGRSELASGMGDEQLTLASGVGAVPVWLAGVKSEMPAFLGSSGRSELASGMGAVPISLAGLSPGARMAG